MVFFNSVVPIASLKRLVVFLCVNDVDSILFRRVMHSANDSHVEDHVSPCDKSIEILIADPGCVTS